ncbi:hypothetical protein [Cystobacter ferrugineus]|uniref:DUF4440 domain-containing protein n=1 Tax=Cystobacter ferrugineus TaxID=83449 RepID=A0A1L9B3K5_9BACT|nr:hypothetical protein [Cystobacter ferrugineus]OJH36824.1 hypothetical protein BON30_30430 [Cystobacter ferrugineus]
MRRWSLLLLLSAAPALSQENPPTEAPPAQAPAAEAPASEAPAAEAPAAESPRPSRRRSRTRSEPPAPTPAPAEAPAPTPAAEVAEPRPTSRTGSEQERIRKVAHHLVDSLLSGDVRGAVAYLAFPFQLEERRFDAPEPLVATWVKELRNKRTDLVTLYDIEVLPYAELERKYGKPPARLGAIIPRGTEVYAAVANLSGRAAIILYRQTEDGWKAFAYTD